jgi:putative transposase
MRQYNYKERTARNLPHYHPPQATLFLTFRLAGTVPRPVLRKYSSEKQWLTNEIRRVERLTVNDDSEELQHHQKRVHDFHRRWFRELQDILHRAETGPTWLKNEAVAKIVVDALHYRDGSAFRLDSYCVMSNHVHTVFAPFLSAAELRESRSSRGLSFLSENPPLDAIMKSLKGYTAWKANRVLGRKGSFWEQESYDHVIRDDIEYHRIMNYVLNNPVKAGLVSNWKEWKWSYRRPDVA